MKKTLLLFILSVCASHLTAQKYWSKNYGFFTGNSYATQIIQTPDGLVVSPLAFCDNNSRECVGLMKFDFDGNLIWETVLYDSLEINHAEQILFWKDTLWLHTNYVTNPLGQYVISAFDLDGNFIHSASYAHPGKQGYHFSGEINALEDRVFVSFFYRNENTNRARVAVRAMSKDFSPLWEIEVPNFYQYPLADNFEPTSDGGIVIIYSALKGWKARAVIEKYDANGKLSWQTPFPTDFDNNAIYVDIDTHPDGGYVGMWNIDTFLVGIYPYPPLIFKMDASGKFEWQKVEYERRMEILDVFSAHNGDIIVSGYENGIEAGPDNFSGYIARYDSKGERKWERKIFDGRRGGWLNFLYNGTELPNGDLVFCGQWYDTINPPEDPFPSKVWLVKVDSNGCFAPGCDFEQHLVPAHEATGGKEAGGFALFPNPFSRQITIGTLLGYKAPSGEYRAVVYDAAGRRVAEQDFDPDLLLFFDTSDFPAGLYTVAVFRDGQALQSLLAVKRE